MVTKETEGSGWSVYTFVSRFMGKRLRPFHESVEDFKAIAVNESFMPHTGTLSSKYWGKNRSSRMPPVAMSSSLDRDVAQANRQKKKL